MRKQSTETQLRHAKREVRIVTAKYSNTYAELFKRRNVGHQMSNVFFNLKQDASIPERYRTQFDELQKAWDAIERYDK